LVGDEYEVLGEYKNTMTKILMKHNKCNHQWLITPCHFLEGTRCNKCGGTLKYTTETFKEKMYELIGNEYEVLGEYKNVMTKILIKHNICDYEYYVIPNNFLKGQRCPRCAGVLPYTTETFKEKIKILTNDEYEVLDEYMNNRTKISIKHNICNNIYKVAPSNFLCGNRCPICAESKGEQRVRYWLEDSNIKFKTQYIFDDLKDAKCLKFDFGVLDKNNNLKYLIEYDGKQHYEWIEGWMTKKEFKKLQYHDQLKNNYCEQNNIQLIRISYWEFDNIENILKNKLVNI
jgi:hypothetical protein